MKTIPEKQIRSGDLFLYFLVGFFVCFLSVVFTTLYSYKVIYNQSVSASTTTLQAALKTEKQKLTSLVSSYAKWNQAYDNILTHFNASWIHENILQDLQHNFEVPFVGIFKNDRAFTSLYSSDPLVGIKEKSAPNYLIEVLSAMEKYLGREKAITRWIKIHNRIYLSSVSVVENSGGGKNLGGKKGAAYLLALKPIDSNFLKELSTDYSLMEMSLFTNHSQLGSNPSVSLEDDMKIVGYISWSAQDNAQNILMVLIPAGFIVLLLLSGVGFVLSRPVVRMFRGYQNVSEELIDTNNQLTRAKQDIIQSKQAKTQFLSLMSHEIKTPMTGLVGMVNLLKDTHLDEKQISYVNTMENSADSLIKLVDNILEFSKLESNEVRLTYGEVNLRQIVSEIQALMMPISIQKKLEFTVHFTDDVPLIIRTDGVRLRQIVLHLVSNALKFTKIGTVKVSVTSTDLPDNRVELGIQVIDTGIGIPEGIKESLFDSFFQAGKASPSPNNGAGLGLGIVNNLVNLLQGKIGIESKLGQGSVFWVQLEVEVVTRLKKKGEENLPKGFHSVGTVQKNILMIDKEEGSLAQNLLKKNGNRIVSVPTSSEAIPYLSRQSFDAVVINIGQEEQSWGDVAAAPLRSSFENSKEGKKIPPIIAIMGENMDGVDLNQYDSIIHTPLTSSKLKALFPG